MHAANQASAAAATSEATKSLQANATEIRRWIARALRHSDTGHLVHRLDAVLMVATGHACAEVGAWFGVDKRTVQRWVHQAQTIGFPGLQEHHAGGRQHRLTREQLQCVAQLLKAPPHALGYSEKRWSGKRLALHIHHTFGVMLSARSCQRLIATDGKLRH